MRLTNEVYLIGSGSLGFAMTDPLDCHIYAIDGGDEIAIIDAGLGRQTERLLDHLRADGLDPARVRSIILTHAHGDHAGGLARLRELTGARIAVPAEAAPWVEAADEAKINLGSQAGRFYPLDYRWQPARSIALNDGDTIGRPPDAAGHRDAGTLPWARRISRRCYGPGAVRR
jgi:glyoxylase-like metal-dependent hydrolase (beta-lactamase superfamily II)